ncbi:MAG: GntR family transcriptional regulator [Actinomycetota bacterium]
MTDVKRYGGGRGRKLLTDVVRDELRRDLLSGTYSPGDKLPAEPDLAASYGVSRITLREAVRGLVEEGYLSRQHGLGTYVTKKPRLRNNLDTNFGVTQLIRSMGFTPGNEDVRVSEEPSTEAVARALALEPGHPVARLERLRTADGDPIVYSVEFMPMEILPRGLEDLRGLSGSLYELLADLGHPVDHGIASIKPVLADREMARRLKTKPDHPLLLLEQVDYGPGDRPELFSREWYSCEELEVTVYRKGPSLGTDATAMPTTGDPNGARTPPA